MKLSISIMTHPKREQLAEKLAENVFNETKVYPKVLVDSDSKGHVFNGKRAWLSYEDSASHHLVLEDDIRLCKGFGSLLSKVIEIKGFSLLSLFHIKNKQLWFYPESNFVKMTHISWNQAIILPTPYIPWLNRVFEQNSYKWVDDYLTDLCKGFKLDMWLVIPNLVQHVLPHNSLTGNPKKLGRKERISPIFWDDFPQEITAKSATGYL